MSESLDREQATLYYRERLEEALHSIRYHRQTWNVPITFVSHPLSGKTEEAELRNILQLGIILTELSSLYSTICFNQLVHHGKFDPHDPRYLDIKFEIFYRGIVEACDQVFTVEGHELSEGCRKEIEYARQCGKPVYLLNTRKLFEDGLPEEEDLPKSKDKVASWCDFSGKRLHFMRTAFSIRPRRGLEKGLRWKSVVKPLPK